MISYELSETQEGRHIRSFAIVLYLIIKVQITDRVCWAQIIRQRGRRTQLGICLGWNSNLIDEI